MKNLFTTEGRIPRSTYWIYFICLNVFLALLGGIAGAMKSEAAQGVAGLMALPVAIIWVIAQIKRWHDRNKSGWWVLINFVPCIGWIWALIECGFLRGTVGPNEYGPDPLQR